MVNEPDPMKISDNTAALRKIPNSEADLNEDFPSSNEGFISPRETLTRPGAFPVLAGFPNSGAEPMGSRQVR